MTADNNNDNTKIFVVFGRPGAGKTTLAEAAMAKLDNETSFRALELMDLDVCVPQWMRDNFAQGKYPTLEERLGFAQSACQHVREAIRRQSTESIPQQEGVALVSFSFVNTDLRDVFRREFPAATWILIDTTEAESQVRIEQRQGHFYKGKSTGQDGASSAPEDTKPKINDKDNSEWEFAPVTFPHVSLDGMATIEENAQRIVEEISQHL